MAHVVVTENNTLTVFPSQVPEYCHKPNEKEYLSWPLRPIVNYGTECVSMFSTGDTELGLGCLQDPVT